MQVSDQRGLSYSAEDPAAVEAFDAVMLGYLNYAADTMDRLSALVRDHDLPMAQCFRACLLKMGSDPRFRPMLTDIVAALEGADLNAREHLHLAALQRWIAEDMAGACAIYEQILASHPHDVLAAKCAHNMHFYAGDMIALRDSVGRILPHWEDDDPWRSFIAGMYSFGLEESGDYDTALRIGQAASDANPGDIWAAHAVAHVYEMRGERRAGIEWISARLPDWQGVNNFVYHMHWHKALAHIGEGELDEAMAIYDEHLVNALAADFYLDVCNAASLLWRLGMRGYDVGDRWEALRPYASQRITDDELVFVTLHYLMVPAMTGDAALVADGLRGMKQWGGSTSTQGQVAHDVGVPMAEGIAAMLVDGAVQGARQMDAVRGDIVRIGGSHAQRQLFEEAMAHYGAA